MIFKYFNGLIFFLRQLFLLSEMYSLDVNQFRNCKQIIVYDE